MVGERPVSDSRSVDKAKVFISWSGEPARSVASALRTWLPRVCQTLEPFMSDSDIAAGDGWFGVISTRLRESDFAILCVTPTNLESPWLHFEAGAVALAHDPTSVAPRTVMPYLFNLEVAHLRPPLSMFNAVTTAEDGTWRLVRSINERLPAPLSPGDLRSTFDKWWPDLRIDLQRLHREVPTEPAAPRPEGDVLQEILATVRGLERRNDTATVPWSAASRVQLLETEAARALGRLPVSWTVGEDEVIVIYVAPQRRELPELQDAIRHLTRLGAMVSLKDP